MDTNSFDFNSKFNHENANYTKPASKDLMQLQNRLMLFCLLDNRFYKLAFLDRRALRYEAWGERMTRFIRFNDAILFDYLDQEKFDQLYQQYISKYIPDRNSSKPKTKEYFISWFEEYEGRPNSLPEHREDRLI